MKIAYYGGAFCGFQNQKGSLSVSCAIKAALLSIGIFSDFVGSGRTDKGVHATAQVISLEIPYYWYDLNRLKEHINSKLLPWIKVKHIWQVPLDFHARFSAKRRGYCYLLSKRDSPFFNTLSLPYQINNITLCKQALRLFVGTHNFKGFMKKGGCGDINYQNFKREKNTIEATKRTIYQARLKESKYFWILSFWGNGFLRSQIRLMVGFLLEIDKGHLSLEELKTQLMGEEIYRIPVKPNGLFLTRVDY